MGGPLMLLNLLVVLRPLAQRPGVGAAAAQSLLEGGFYAGFVLATVPLLAFAWREDLSKEAVSRRGVVPSRGARTSRHFSRSGLTGGPWQYRCVVHSPGFHRC